MTIKSNISSKEANHDEVVALIIPGGYVPELPIVTFEYKK
jgi:hypothetical protein